MRGSGAAVRRRQARRARGARCAAPAQSRYLVEPNVKDGKGGLRDLQHAVLDRQIRLPRARAEGAGRARRVRPRGIQAVPQRCEDFLWAVRCHMHFVTGRAEERLSFDIQREIAVRLGYTAHPRHAGRRALHEALFPGRQGCRRPHRDRLRRAGGARGQARAGARPHDRRASAAAAPRRARLRRLRRRQQPHQHRRRGCRSSAIRSTSSACSGSRRSTTSRSIRTRCGVATRSLRLIDQKLRDDQRRTGLFLEILTSRRRRGGAAAHERGRRARPLRPRLRPHRRDDAVQHVSPLHGGRASAALHRHPGRHRGRAARRRVSRSPAS